MINPYFIETPCIFCKNPDDKVLFRARLYQDTFQPYAFSARRSRRREHYRIVQCQRCGLVRSTPILEAGRLESLYAESLFFYGEEATHATETYAELVDSLIGQGMGKGKIRSLLEIGCGNGLFLEKAKEAGPTGDKDADERSSYNSDTLAGQDGPVETHRDDGHRPFQRSILTNPGVPPV